MILEPQRESFGGLEDGIAYLNCAYMSPQLKVSVAAGERALSCRSRPWRITARDFFEEPEESRRLFARLVGGDPDGVALVPSASYGIAVAARNLVTGAGRRMLVLEEEFPSNYYAWAELAAKTGAKLETVPRPGDDDWTRVVLERLDESVDVVAAPNCHWTDGSFVDLERIGEEARRAGAALVVDATQSLGAHPLDMRRVRPDFLVAAAYKWLLGPYGVAFLWAAEGRREGTPIEYNWINRAGSEDFSGLAGYAAGFQPGARRYDAGERSNFILLPMANAALRQLLEWGVENVSETLGTLTDIVEEGAPELGLRPVPRARRVRHMIGLRLPSGQAAEIAGRLAERGVFVSSRGACLRVSPHLYNTREDVLRLLDELSWILRPGPTRR
ncbi:Isopenicillin N epimerase [Rubrobacter xylanophilus DSM 9941]|uniref:aminotransferase class V-fold PLP-dependent enzyme n=1 Tax=Rubrobacter xylanophilus TaxID=49319 RepID=UPI001C643208|nr:aminotransferase class V-fold PLP-dependent enzyme [Rubrobacter xylanophilus]QYJ15369.1 Isopenicillin N epimerase [Rubrobacter xylanophilus DSM 9941]